MFLLDLFRYVRGGVCFSVQGDFIERFLNLAARDHIPIWDGRKKGNTYQGNTDISGYRRLRAHARKSGVRMRIVEKKGVPFRRYRYRHRHGLLAGVVLFAAFLMVMSSFIWRIEIHGNEKVSDTTILAVLKEVGVEPGTRRASLDVRDCERRAQLLLQEISWIALNVDGSTVTVEVNESVSPPDMVDPQKPCNIVAGMSGQIVKMNVYEGQPLVETGDAVQAGDVVVSGIMQDRRGQNLFRHATAQIVARVSHTITVRVPMEQTKYVETGKERSRNFLIVSGFEIPMFLPFNIPLPYHVERESIPLRIFSLETPLSRLHERYVLMEEVPVTLTPDEARELALIELAAAEQIELGGAEILEKTGTARTEDGMYIVTANYICTMDIALEKEIFLDDGEPEAGSAS